MFFPPKESELYSKHEIFLEVMLVDVRQQGIRQWDLGDTGEEWERQKIVCGMDFPFKPRP